MSSTVAEPVLELQTATEWQPREKPSFSEVYETVRLAQQGTWDTLIDPSDLQMKDGRLVVCPELGGTRSLAITQWASNQLCQRLNMPSAYFKRCPAELQDAQANHWLEHFAWEKSEAGESSSAKGRKASKTRWLLRAQNERLRAVLSDRYTPLDNAVLIEHLKPVIGDRYHADWFGMDGESLHLRLFDPSMKRDVLPDDPIMAGIHVSNSEVGKRAITIDALLYRQICSNGMIALVRGQSLMQRRHVGIHECDFVAEVEKAVALACESAHYTLDRFSATIKEPVTDVEKTLERIGLSWDLGKSTQELVKEALLREAPSQQQTLYGLINAVTNAAQRLKLDERYHLEMLAGQLMQNGLPSPRLVRSHTKTNDE